MAQVEFVDAHRISLEETRDPLATPIAGLVNELERCWSKLSIDSLCRLGDRGFSDIVFSTVPGGSFEDFLSLIASEYEHLPHRDLPQQAEELDALKRLIELGFVADGRRSFCSKKLKAVRLELDGEISVEYDDGDTAPFDLQKKLAFGEGIYDLIYANAKRHTVWDQSLIRSILEKAAVSYSYGSPVEPVKAYHDRGPLPRLRGVYYKRIPPKLAPGPLDRSILVQLCRALDESTVVWPLADSVYVEADRFAARICVRSHSEILRLSEASVQVSRIVGWSYRREREPNFNGCVATCWRTSYDMSDRHSGPVYPLGYYIFTSTHALEVHIEPKAFC